jgi:O-antigen/teichoic acid export membrane protein
LKREFLINIAFLILINLLIKPVYILFIESRVQDTLGPNAYGLYFGIFNFAIMLQIIADLGIQNFNSTAVSRDNSLLKTYLPKMLGLKVILALFYLVLGLTGAILIGYAAGSILIFTWVSFNFILLSFILYLRTNISGTGHYKMDSILSIVDKLLLIGILGWMLFWGQNGRTFGLYDFILSQSVAYSIVLTLVLIINFRLAGMVKISFDLALSREIIRQSLPFSLVIILMSLYNRMDGFMLERMLDDNAFQAGIYAASFRIYDALNMVGYLFAVLLLPMFSSLMYSPKDLHVLIKTGHNLILGVSIAMLAGIGLFAEQILSWMYPNHMDENYIHLLYLLLLSFFATSLSYNYGTLLTAAKKLRPMNRILFIGVLINLVLNLIFIPQFGAIGAALTTIGTQFFVLAGQYILSLTIFNIKFRWAVLIKRSGFVATVGIMVWFFARYLDLGRWLLELFIFELLVFIAILIFGLVSWKDLKKEHKIAGN